MIPNDSAAIVVHGSLRTEACAEQERAAQR